jgi:hypothetical protein
MVQIYLPPSPAGQTGCASRSTLLAEQALSQNSNLKARGGHTQQSVYSGSVQEDSKRSSIFGKFKTKLGRKKGKQEGVPVIGARTGQKRDTIQIFPYSNAQSARKSMQSVLSAKVNVSDARAQDLYVLLDRSRTQLAQQRHAFLMQHSGPSAAAHGPPVPVLLLNFLPDQVLNSACSLYL